MAKIINNTDGIEVTDKGGSVYFIKYSNCKIIKTNGTISIYDNSENRRGANALRFKASDITEPVVSDINELYSTIINFID